jgi:hypothetical protein
MRAIRLRQQVPTSSTLFAKQPRPFQGGPLANYMPYTPRTEGQIKELASLKPLLCATMHGSTFAGDGERP